MLALFAVAALCAGGFGVWWQRAYVWPSVSYFSHIVNRDWAFEGIERFRLTAAQLRGRESAYRITRHGSQGPWSASKSLTARAIRTRDAF